MRNLLLVASAVLSLAAGGAQAASVSDATGDFLPSFSGSTELDTDLDVTFFSVNYDSLAQAFNFKATMAADINPLRPGAYVIGVNTGTGPIAPFGDIGNGNVIFNQAIAILKDGTTFLDANVLSATISGATLSLAVPLSMLPTTGFNPNQYAFNIWPRNGLNPADNTEISDFAPNNANLPAVPEPATWAVMILGFGLAGAALRRQRVRGALPSLA